MDEQLKIILIIISLIFFIPKVFAVTLSEALTQARLDKNEIEQSKRAYIAELQARYPNLPFLRLASFF